MSNPGLVLIAVLVLAVGTFSLRIAGPLLRTRFEMPERAEKTMSAAAVVLLAALVATAALAQRGSHGRRAFWSAECLPCARFRSCSWSSPRLRRRPDCGCSAYRDPPFRTGLAGENSPCRLAGG